MFLNLEKINKNKIAAWAVHGFTGSGAVLGFLAIIAILNSDAVGAFLWLGLALLIDGLDGTLARKVKVTEQTPNIDGTILDSVIDYLNYVIIPSLMIYWFGMVPGILEIVLPAAIFLVSLFTFANLQMKTEDYYFRGFPAVWNIVVLYFFILGLTHRDSTRAFNYDIRNGRRFPRSAARGGLSFSRSSPFFSKKIIKDVAQTYRLVIAHILSVIGNIFDVPQNRAGSPAQRRCPRRSVTSGKLDWSPE